MIIRHPYLKILDLANLFVTDAPMKKKSRNLVLPPSRSTLKYGSKNRPWVRGLKGIFFLFASLRSFLVPRLSVRIQIRGSKSWRSIVQISLHILSRFDLEPWYLNIRWRNRSALKDQFLVFALFKAFT